MLRVLKLQLLTILLLFVGASILGQALASDAIQQLDKYFSEVNSFEGQFIQIVYDENGEVLQKN